MSKHIEKAANNVMEALGLQKEWATVIKPLREQGFTVELAYTMEKIANAAQARGARTSFEFLQDIRMALATNHQSTLEAEFHSLLERYGCKRSVAMALLFTQIVEILEKE